MISKRSIDLETCHLYSKYTVQSLQSTAFSVATIAPLTGVAFCQARNTIEILVEPGMYITVVYANTIRLGFKNDYTYH